MKETNYVSSNAIIGDFVSRGLVVLGPDEIGIDPAVHDRIYEQEKALFSAKKLVDASSIPEILDVIDSPGVVGACDTLVGKDWAIVPFTHNTPFASGSHDQHWHKDDNGPFNSRKHRHHQAVQLEMLYYPQAVATDMGPTATVPYSQYWTFNHEENHDNFAGADHLDFNYQIEGLEREPISGPKSTYDVAEIVAGRTKHDIRMREAVANLGWPLVKSFEVAPLEAGSVVIYSHNLFHRGNHRRDDWRRWKAHPRFMWRFWLFRTHEPERRIARVPVWAGTDELTGIELDDVDQGTRNLWEAQFRWLTVADELVVPVDRAIVEPLKRDLFATGDDAEPQRIGAAYQLAMSAERESALAVLASGLHAERESVRRAATYGLVAMGEPATETWIDAIASPAKWVRKAGAFGLGAAGRVDGFSVQCLVDALRDDESLYVRSVAADALGCLIRRAAPAHRTALGPEVIAALIESLEREGNRLAMNLAQGRSIKFVRPTDEADVCEGIGITHNVKGYKPVRSIVRENALWALVIISSQRTDWPAGTSKALRAALVAVIEADENIFAAGLAMDALVRLSVGDLDDEVERLLKEAPKRSWEALIRSGLDRARLRAWEPGALND